MGKEESTKKLTKINVKPFGFGGPEILCDVCFTPESDVGNDGNLPENQYPFIQCRTCKLLAHSICFTPPGPVDERGYFDCDACIKLQEEPKQPTESIIKAESQRKTKEFIPKPLPSNIDGEDDGRLYPPPKYPGALNMFCVLCNRRDVRGGIKPTYGFHWCHLACSMSSPYLYTLANRLTGIKNALVKSRRIARETEGFKNPTCECCLRPGGMLIRCAHNHESSTKKTCRVFMHPLCAELGERARVILEKRNGDIILYKCALHSFGEDAKCNICGLCTRQNEILECDSCSRGFHMSCLPTPLSGVPDGDWFCPICKPEDHALPGKDDKNTLATEKNAKISTSTEEKHDDNSLQEGKTITSTTMKEQRDDSSSTKKTEKSNPNKSTIGNYFSEIKSVTTSSTKNNHDASNTSQENDIPVTKKLHQQNEPMKTTTVDSTPTVGLSNSDKKETEHSTSNLQPQDPSVDESVDVLGCRSRIKRHKTADSFPIGDPSIDYALGTFKPEALKLL